ncbi:hypothetical protein [Methylomonas sp. AM2-LC]|uniref:hypothetical protein n=1 Tax=Methylomonas sp. AM2-LC TaxID=3153301 RepID=UPI003263F14F
MKLGILRLAVLASVFISGSVFADTEIFTHTTPPKIDSNFDINARFSDTFTLPSFNKALGILNSVEVLVSVSGTDSVTAFNSAGSEQTTTIDTPFGVVSYSVWQWQVWQIQAIGIIPVTVSGLNGVSYVDNLSVSMLGATSSTSSATVLGDALPVSHSNSQTLTTNLFDFEKNTLPVTLNIHFGSPNVVATGFPTGQVFFNSEAVVGGTTEIIYNYTPTAVNSIPEPELLTLFLLGLPLITLALRRKLDT